MVSWKEDYTLWNLIRIYSLHKIRRGGSFVGAESETWCREKWKLILIVLRALLIDKRPLLWIGIIQSHEIHCWLEQYNFYKSTKNLTHFCCDQSRACLFVTYAPSNHFVLNSLLSHICLYPLPSFNCLDPRRDHGLSGLSASDLRHLRLHLQAGALDPTEEIPRRGRSVGHCGEGNYASRFAEKSH